MSKQAVCFLAALVSTFMAAAAEIPDEEVSLLQTSVVHQGVPPSLAAALTLPLPSGHYETGGVTCGLDHSEDLYRYIPDVLAEHPGVDGFCYFEKHAPWFSYVGPVEDYEQWGRNGVLGMRSNPVMCPNFPGVGKGPLTQMHYEGVDFWSHVDCIHQFGDDVYCHALGWLKNQRLDASLMANATAWRQLAEQECQHMNETYHFAREEVTVGKHLDDQGYIYSGPMCNARNLNLHAYHKCALGHAAEEMAYCMNVGCVLPPGNFVGRGPLLSDGRLCALGLRGRGDEPQGKTGVT
eukprot:CAMPEP_0171060226 /NCGR_PEP_ID=MMETSP0766_2-20121228/3698_1 /TAXON_ID=439317 /ORGANISM="Gambierdiscus australes, Strain CAWD 149" /LENGTH=293 /DNA_ID=CAMNT_0011515779 /DNA_START=63 /DNA_END=941 /DNA_ORIENTATION=-